MIAGLARGMKLKTPKGSNTRPTVDKVKESLFNIISPYMNESSVLDLFSGTGALAIESLSRGATGATMVEADRKCCNIIRENLAHTGMSDRGLVYCMKVSKAISELGRKGDKFDIVFMDPPYLKNFIQETLQLLITNDIIINNGIVIVEHHKNETVPDVIGTLKKVRTQTYGETHISFLVQEDEG